jgi:hypothetical protein
MRIVKRSVYTFLIISLDLLSIINPVILKFMKKNAAINTITLRQFKVIVKILRV